MALAELIFLALSLIVLAKASKLVIDGSIALADFFRVGHMATGFILVSTATSLPELMVGVLSAGQGHGAIAVGNVFGSNVADVLVVIGLAVFLYGIRIHRKEWRDITLMLVLVSVITVAIIFVGGLERLEGIFLILLYGAYIVYLFRQNTDVHIQNHASRSTALRAFVVFSIGILLVLISASFVVEMAVTLAGTLGLAKSFIGATVIAFGTSLPEIAVNLEAARKKKYGLALGNAIGSVATNLTLVLGVTAFLRPIPLNLPIFSVFLTFSVFANMLLFYMVATTKRLGRREGLIMLLTYVIYLAVIFHAQLGTIE